MARIGAEREEETDRTPGGEAPGWALRLMGVQKVIVGGAFGISVVLWITLELGLAALISAAIMIVAGLILWRADRLVKRAR